MSESGEAGKQPSPPKEAKQGGKEGQESKQAAKEKRMQERAAREAAAKTAKEAEAAAAADQCGVLPLIQSQSRPGRQYTHISELTPALAGKVVLLRARLFTTRGQGNVAFLVLRSAVYTVQAVVDKNGTSKACVAFAQKISRESLVEVEGEVTKATVDCATQQDVEVRVRKVFVVSEATPSLPLQVEDCQRPQPVLDAQEKEVAEVEARLQALEAELKGAEGGAAALEAGKKATLEAEVARLQKEKAEKRRFVNPSQDTRLNHRILDLRSQTSHAIFRVQSHVCQLFREFLLGEGFVEIHTPKMISAASEGGANVFQLKYFDQTAYLAQSPQLYKQMAVIGDLERVFEIGPVFRAENSFTHRHLTEFTGLDLEMAFREHYHEVLEVIERLFLHLFDGLPQRCARELDIINLQFPFAPLRFRSAAAQGGGVLRLNFPEGIALLRAAGEQAADLEDLSTAQERRLGQLVRDKYGVDFYILNRFPAAARPFYTMPAPDDPRYTNSYDIFVRGEEIVSGSQRIHDAAMLEARARAAGVSLPTIAPYLEAFKYGAPPHGGCGIGLERIVMLYLGLNNIRKTSMFPRDPQRITP